jgi:hypothetical protein
MYGIDMEPYPNGLNITLDSPAKDYGVSLGSAYNSSINSVARPSDAGWDIGAYEYIEDGLEDYPVHVYPNPCRVFRDENYITFSGSLSSSDAIKIYDINGRLVNNSGSLTEAIYQWNVGEVPSGVYLYVVKSADGQNKTSGKIAIIR